MTYHSVTTGNECGGVELMEDDRAQEIFLNNNSHSEGGRDVETIRTEYANDQNIDEKH